MPNLASCTRLPYAASVGKCCPRIDAFFNDICAVRAANVGLPNCSNGTCRALHSGRHDAGWHGAADA